MLSRSCNAEQALKMSLGKNWEGKASDEAEPEELPDFDAVKLLRWMGWRNLFDAFMYLCAEKRFIFVSISLGFGINAVRETAKNFKGGLK